MIEVDRLPKPKAWFNVWELYESHPQFYEADKLMNAAWEYAKTLSTAIKAERYMYKIMDDLKEVGALDTEPCYHLARALYKHYNNYDFESYWRID